MSRRLPPSSPLKKSLDSPVILSVTGAITSWY
jgi:hypothetical protein